MNAILYVNRTGIAWRYLPHDFPPHATVFSHFSAWTADGTIEKLGVRLHRLVREKEGRDPEPTACVIDAQSVTAPSVPMETQGIDAGKQLLTRIAESHPTVTKAWVDTGYKTQAVEHRAKLGIDFYVVPRNAQVRGFSIVPRR